MANRHTQLGLTDEKALNIYKTMVLARKLDERTWLLNRSGKIPFVISCQGQEAAQVGAAFALDRERDYIAPYYRDLGVVLAFGMTAKEIMLFSFAKAEDPNSGGRQMPGHYGQKKNRILTGSSPVTTQIPHAAGVALAAKMERKEIVSFVTLGEGSTNQGDFHEGLNFAGVQKLPLITMVENNQYAISVPMEKQVASKNVSVRALSYGMEGVTVDGNDPLAVYEAVQKARKRAVNGEGGTIIEAVTYRFTPHSSDDDDQYRAQEDIKNARKKDALISYAEYLKSENVLTDEIEKQIIDEIAVVVNEATDYAENAPYAAPEHALRYVYEEGE